MNVIALYLSRGKERGGSGDAKSYAIAQNSKELHRDLIIGN